MADIRDDEMMQDWRDSLSSLLLFVSLSFKVIWCTDPIQAAIFVAVLTAFIVESKNLLQQDPQDVLVDIFIEFTGQMANGTYHRLTRPTFDPPRYAIVINALLFASISLSLAAAMISVLALQWVNEYDSKLDTSEFKKRALRRHWRFTGVEKWKMQGIIAALPVLLQPAPFSKGYQITLTDIEHPALRLIAARLCGPPDLSGTLDQESLDAIKSAMQSLQGPGGLLEILGHKKRTPVNVKKRGIQKEQ
jgi:hypothetical protein